MTEQEQGDITSAVATLRRMGLDPMALAQIAQADPAEGLRVAQLISEGGEDAVRGINRLQRQIAQSARELARSRRLGSMPDRRVTEDMVTRALEVLASGPPDRDLVRRALEDALLAPGAAQVVTEYGTPFKSGDWRLWNTEPLVERYAPLAERIEGARGNGDSVSRRSIIVVDDWTEVTGP